MTSKVAVVHDENTKNQILKLLSEHKWRRTLKPTKEDVIRKWYDTICISSLLYEDDALYISQNDITDALTRFGVGICVTPSKIAQLLKKESKMLNDIIYVHQKKKILN